MPTIEIPEDLDVALEGAALRAGRSKDTFALEILSAHLEDESLPLSAFSEADIAKLKLGIEQLNRGECFDSDHVDRKFEAFRARLAAR